MGKISDAYEAKYGGGTDQGTMSQPSGGGGLMAPATWGARGLNKGFTDVIGAPVDLTAAGLRAAGIDIPPNPLGGSASLRQGFDVISELAGGSQAAYEDIQEVPEAYRPIAKGTEVVGGSLPFFLGPVAAAARPAQALPLAAKPPLMAPIVNAARDAPGTFAAVEGLSTAGAGTARGVAESVFPGNEGVGIGAEIVGGTLAPGAMLGRGIMNAPVIFNRVKQLTSKSGKEYKAGEGLRKALISEGEDPGAVAGRLEAPPAVEGARYPSAAKSGSPVLAALEDNLYKKMPNVGNEGREMMREATRTLNSAYRMAVESGDPQAIQLASRARQDWFETMLQARVQDAQVGVENAAESLVSQGGRQQASTRTRETLLDSLGDARAAEEALWANVPRNVEIAPNGTMDAYRYVQSRRLPADTFPARIESTLQDFAARSERGERITSGELQELRKLALEEERIARANMQFTRANRLGTIANGRTLEDGSRAGGVLDDIAGLSEEARSYSRALNDVYTRGEVGNILGTNRQGGEKLAPELTLEKSVARGGPQGDVSSRAIEEAAAFTGRTTRPEQDILLRDMATRALNPDGTVNPDKLARFRLDNLDMLERFPEVNTALNSTEQAQRLADDALRNADSTRKAVQQSAFGKLAGFDDPVKGLKASFTGKTPLTDYKQLATTARRGGPEAVAGLRGATFDMLFDMAQTGDLTSGKAMRGLLTKKAGSGDSLADVMSSSGVLNTKQKDNLFRVISEVERIEDMMQSGKQLDEILENASGLEDLAARIIGANLGGASGLAQASGSGLVLAQMGSKKMRQLINDLPLEKTEAILGEAVNNPEYMAELIKRPKDVAARQKMYRQMNAFLMQAGVPETDDRETYFGP